MVDQHKTPELPGTANAIATLRSTPIRFASILSDYRKATRAAASDRRLSGEGKDAARAKAAQQAKDDLAIFSRAAASAHAKATEAIASTFRGEDVGPTERLYREIRASRIEARQRELLSGGLSPRELIKRATASGDLEALQVLKEFVPDYVEAAARPDARAIERSAILLEIDQAEVPLLSPEQQMARALEAEINTGAHRLEVAERLTVREIEGGDPADVLPEWGKEVIAMDTFAMAAGGN